MDPDYVLIENVPQLLKLKINYNGNNNTVENIIQKEFGNIYNINENKIINAQDYGVPQNRKRAIILLNKKNKWEFPKKEKKIVTVRDTIGIFRVLKLMLMAIAIILLVMIRKLKNVKKYINGIFQENIR